MTRVFGWEFTSPTCEHWRHSIVYSGWWIKFLIIAWLRDTPNHFNFEYCSCNDEAPQLRYVIRGGVSFWGQLMIAWYFPKTFYIEHYRSWPYRFRFRNLLFLRVALIFKRSTGCYVFWWRTPNKHKTILDLSMTPWNLLTTVLWPLQNKRQTATQWYTCLVTLLLTKRGGGWISFRIYIYIYMWGITCRSHDPEQVLVETSNSFSNLI